MSEITKLPIKRPDNRRLKMHDQADIGRTLSRQLQIAQREHMNAMKVLDEIVSAVPSGLPHPDGAFAWSRLAGSTAALWPHTVMLSIAIPISSFMELSRRTWGKPEPLDRCFASHVASIGSHPGGSHPGSQSPNSSAN